MLGLEKQKLKEGKDLIRYFCTPAKARDGSRFRHYPSDAPEKWALFKAYNLRDVETEMAIQQKLSKFPVTESEWVNYTLDQQINDRGIMLDRTLVPALFMTVVCVSFLMVSNIAFALPPAVGYAIGGGVGLATALWFMVWLRKMRAGARE